MLMRANFVIAATALVGLAGCSSLEYSIREAFGQQKREVLVDRVEAARDSQKNAKQEFVSALERFKTVTGFEGGDLEKKYDTLKAEYDRCDLRAGEVRQRIDAVEDVAHALFREWHDELAQYSDPGLRQISERQLQQTRQSFATLLEIMRAAERRMEPVLATLRDQVLFLKHNLNARAVASVGNVSASLQRDIDALVADMERAIADANRFIEQMQRDPAGG